MMNLTNIVGKVGMHKLKKVHYIGWYIGDSEDDCYTGNIPGKLKMRYIASKLIETGCDLYVLSLADAINKVGLYKKNISTSNNNMVICYSGGCSGKNFLFKLINRFIKKITFIKYILFEVKKDDIVLLYHSVGYTKLLSMLKKVVTRYTICEVEEIYGYSATGDDLACVYREFSSIRTMDAYILVNDYLMKEIGLPIEKCAVCYGVINKPKRTINRRNDGYIHVVYAGTIEGKKLGAYTAVDIAALLTPKYKLHILGFGTEESIQVLKQKIDELNQKAGYIKAEYNGFLSGSELDEFLFGCHIGISTYVMRESFSNNSLPSKIMTYMCHDLAVVRGYAPAFENIEIAKRWNCYLHPDVPSIVEAIEKAQIPQIGEYDCLLNDIDKKLTTFFMRELEK